MRAKSTWPGTAIALGLGGIVLGLWSSFPIYLRVFGGILGLFMLGDVLINFLFRHPDHNQYMARIQFLLVLVLWGVVVSWPPIFRWVLIGGGLIGILRALREMAPADQARTQVILSLSVVGVEILSALWLSWFLR